jgi:hypothetical protein
MVKCCVFFAVRTECSNIIVRYLHGVHKIPVRMIQLENRWTDLDEILYGRYAIGVYPKIIHFNSLKSIIHTWRTNEFVRWDRH